MTDSVETLASGARKAVRLVALGGILGAIGATRTATVVFDHAIPQASANAGHAASLPDAGAEA